MNYPSNYVQDLIEATEKITAAGWHTSTRSGSTGIGKTFEDLLNKKEDNLATPDFFDIEIKTRDRMSNSLITLWTKSPSNPRGANALLREKYGVPAEKFPKVKALHVTVSGKNMTTSSLYRHNFKIRVDRQNERVHLEVYDQSNTLIDDSTYWSFEVLKKQIELKLKIVAIISAETKDTPNGKAYKYHDIHLITGLSLEGLINAIEAGDLKIDLRLGVYGSGKNKGKPHDYGTGFRISLKNLEKYGIVQKIK